MLSEFKNQTSKIIDVFLLRNVSFQFEMSIKVNSINVASIRIYFETNYLLKLLNSNSKLLNFVQTALNANSNVGSVLFP